MNIKETIKETYLEVLEQTGSELLVPELTDDVVLLESGLDSLGFAILVATLEEKLEFDPFTMMDEPLYPTTFGEFVSIYEKMNPNNQI
jgi:acyl carrier protein